MPSPDKTIPPWVDIAALPAPVDEVNLSVVFIIAAIISLVFFLAAYFWQRPRVKALRDLRRIRNQRHDPRQQLLSLRQVLQHALPLNQHQTPALSKMQQTRWQQFDHDLTQACFQANNPDNQTVERFILQARSWLKRY